MNRYMKTAICSIMKDEQKYLKEWIDWHLSLGFDAIYLYEDENSSSHSSIVDEYDNVFLTKYSDLGIIYDKGKSNNQQELYNWFIKEYHGKIDWVLFIDIDEFLTFQDGYDLDLFQNDFKDESSVIIYWKVIGASYIIDNHEDYSIKKYNKECQALLYDRLYNYKSFVNLNNPSYFNENYHHTDYYVNTLYERKKRLTYNKLYIKHYFTKSWNEWKTKIYERGDSIKGHRKIEDFFEKNKEFKPIKYELLNDLFYFNTSLQEKTIFIKEKDSARLGNILFMISFAFKISNGHKIIIDEYFKAARTSLFIKIISFLGLFELCKIDSLKHYKKDYIITDDNADNHKTKYDNVILHGYLQEEPCKEFISLIKKKIDKSILNDYVVISVRRGDYLKPNISKILPVMSREFYLEAMGKFPKDTKFMFTSDDIQWCKDNFKGENIFYNDNGGVEDFKLLLGAKSVIFGNSTFSYWGAILNINDNPNKKIICNKNWYTEESNMNHLTDKIIPKEWVTLNYKYNI